MKRMIIMFSLGVMLFACNSGQTNKDPNSIDMEDRGTEKIPTPGGDPAKYDPDRGTGKFTHVDVGTKLDVAMASDGEKIYNIKCAGCHKVTDEKLVGPGWLGVTKRFKPEWIMNFITNTNEMLNVDPKAQKQLEICLVRMPNQSLTDADARNLLEFMRKNDGVK